VDEVFAYYGKMAIPSIFSMTFSPLDTLMALGTSIPEAIGLPPLRKTSILADNRLTIFFRGL
jgi:hypothetical protein